MKMIAMFKRHPDLTPAQFREEYEKVHVPLALKFCPFFKDYRRNYINRDFNHRRAEGEAAGALDFDVITEFTFANRDDYDRMARQMSDPEFRDRSSSTRSALWITAPRWCSWSMRNGRCFRNSDAAWRDDRRRMANGEQVPRVASPVLATGQAAISVATDSATRRYRPGGAGMTPDPSPLS